MPLLQATVCAKFGLPCIIYMGAKDMERQALNVFRMRLLGAEVRRQHRLPGTPSVHASCCLPSGTSADTTGPALQCPALVDDRAPQALFVTSCPQHQFDQPVLVMGNVWVMCLSSAGDSGCCAKCRQCRVLRPSQRQRPVLRPSQAALWGAMAVVAARRPRRRARKGVFRVTGAGCSGFCARRERRCGRCTRARRR